MTNASSGQALSLSKRLQEAGAKMYGAFWCSHCLDQKQEFGKEAMSSFPYVECFPNGWKRVSGCDFGNLVQLKVSDTSVRSSCNYSADQV